MQAQQVELNGLRAQLAQEKVAERRAEELAAMRDQLASQQKAHEQAMASAMAEAEKRKDEAMRAAEREHGEDAQRTAGRGGAATAA